MSNSERIRKVWKKVLTERGLALTALISIVFLILFYGQPLRHPGITYFGNSNDGMQVYFQTLYHIQYDQDYWSQQSINYPYGESIFFTSAMPMVTNLVKLFGPSAATTGIAIINLLMLFSIPAGAIFLYLIFRRLKLPWFYSSLCAVAIAFLSPQVGRMMGHYALSWVFLIPAMIFMLMRFYEKPGWKISVQIGLLVLLAATTHLYFFVFFLAISCAFWISILLTRDRISTGLLFIVRHAAIQILIPLIVVKLLVMYSDHVQDRTAVPAGYLTYHSNTTGVFFPLGYFYQPLFDTIAAAEPLEWEGQAYIGLAALLGTIAVITSRLYLVFRKKFRCILSITDNKILNIVYWTSLVLLYVAFGHPFIDGHPDWLVYLGPLRQFRAIGRFTWLFYYAANIVAVYQLYHFTRNKKVLQYSAMAVTVAFLWTDVLSATITNSYGGKMNNRIPELEDNNNVLPENSWLKNFNAAEYQAILPLPFFHIGSENILRIPADPKIITQSYIVSLKTGLPIMAVSASRTSISQTINLISLVMDQSGTVTVLNELPDERPLLLVVREAGLDSNEKQLLCIAEPVAISREYSVYSVRPSEISALIQQRYTRVQKEMDSLGKYTVGPFLASDSSQEIIYQSFDESGGTPFLGKGSFTSPIRERTTVYQADIRSAGQYTLTFWMNRINGDVFPRTVLYTTVSDPSNNNDSVGVITNAGISTKMIADGWGLEQVTFSVPFDNAHLRVTIWNDDIGPDETNEVDEVLIIPAGVHVYRAIGDTLYKDNRQFIPRR